MSRHVVHGAFVLVVVSILSVVGRARAEDKIPSVEAIMDSYVEHTGGKDAYARIKNRVTKALMDTQQREVHLTTYEAEPNKRLVEAQSLQALVTRGSDGKVAWRQNGEVATILKDDMLKRALTMALFHMPDKWRELCTKVTCDEIVAVDGKKCYKVAMTTISGFSQIYYIDVKSKLLRRVERPVRVKQRDYLFASQFDDFKKVDGVLYPHKIERTVDGSVDATVKVLSIEHNVELPVGIFELPNAVIVALETQ